MKTLKPEWSLRCEKQKLKGTVVEIGKEEIEVILEGDGAIEHIESMFLRSF